MLVNATGSSNIAIRKARGLKKKKNQQFLLLVEMQGKEILPGTSLGKPPCSQRRGPEFNP